MNRRKSLALIPGVLVGLMAHGPEKREAAASLQAAALARGAGVEEAEALLRRIGNEEERHLRELVDVLGRVDLDV